MSKKTLTIFTGEDAYEKAVSKAQMDTTVGFIIAPKMGQKRLD